MRPFDSIPQGILDGLKNYAERGVPVGDFLQAVLANDLKKSFAKADIKSRAAMFHIVSYVYNYVPGIAQGSQAVYFAWLDLKRLERGGASNEAIRAALEECRAAKDQAERWDAGMIRVDTGEDE